LILVGATVLTVRCRDAAAPDRQAPPPPLLDQTADGGIQLDQSNGTFGQSGTVLIKGFNPTNPHLGDAILATFFWFGTPGGVTGNIIDSVTDVLNTAPFTPVGNKYELVEFVSEGNISVATYLATNVQNFPEGSEPNVPILAVKADLKVPVPDGGILISAWLGVAPTIEQALGEHRSTSGVGSPSTLFGPTIADPGPISVNAGALAYGVSMATPPSVLEDPPGWTPIATLSDNVIKGDGSYDGRFVVSQTGGSAQPQWKWFFTATGTWLASVLALNPAPTTGSLTVTTSTTGENLPEADYTVTLDGAENQSMGINGTVTLTELTPGTHTVALSGVPDNCQVTESNPTDVTVVAGETATVTFTVTCSAPPPPPPPPPQLPPDDFMTGGGKLGSGREFATFGLQASSSDGKFKWEQHCPDGPNPASPLCAHGKFKFKGTVTAGSYAQGSAGSTCRTWSGTGESKETGARNFTVREACDGGEPGRGVDYLEVEIGDYQNSGYLSGGNIQLHRSKP
jgi:hypothetical protein